VRLELDAGTSPPESGRSGTDATGVMVILAGPSSALGGTVSVYVVPSAAVAVITVCSWGMTCFDTARSACKVGSTVIGSGVCGKFGVQRARTGSGGSTPNGATCARR
jgi:hypothetical protein